MAKDQNLTYRVDQLEKKYDDMNQKIDKIMTNHLPHLALDVKDSIDKIETVKAENRVLAIINAAAIVVGILVAKVFGAI